MVRRRIFMNTVKIEVKVTFSARTYSFFTNLGNILKQQWAYFKGFYCVQSSCISVDFSIFLAYFTKKRKQNFSMARK